MKTLLTRMKTATQDDATLKAYVKKVEIVSPNTLPLLSLNDIPYIGLAPMNSPEEWVAQKKEAVHTVEVYLALQYMINEYSIIGNAPDKGILDLVADFESVVRGNFFPSDPNNTDTRHLARPTDITSVDYSTTPWGDNFHLIIATVTLSCARRFSV